MAWVWGRASAACPTGSEAVGLASAVVVCAYLSPCDLSPLSVHEAQLASRSRLVVVCICICIVCYVVEVVFFLFFVISCRYFFFFSNVHNYFQGLGGRAVIRTEPCLLL